jgi:hypothetical protein
LNLLGAKITVLATQAKAGVQYLPIDFTVKN